MAMAQTAMDHVHIYIYTYFLPKPCLVRCTFYTKQLHKGFRCELLCKTLIVRPEEADVRNTEKHLSTAGYHGQKRIESHWIMKQNDKNVHLHRESMIKLMKIVENCESILFYPILDWKMKKRDFGSFSSPKFNAAMAMPL